mmetsp:Transcript_4043/g.14262  ORF Transcript_4043/g.14262 Transcript_4043/m.14262 type:complete len:113 (-) Transcript_4043:1004-1342(-)
MTVDFLARKQSKKNAKRLASLNKKGENERRNRAKRGRNRNTVGMCNFAPPLPPALAEEDEQNEAEKKNQEEEDGEGKVGEESDEEESEDGDGEERDGRKRRKRRGNGWRLGR